MSQRLIKVVGQEIWKSIDGFEGYEISNLGNVRSYRNRGGHGLVDIPHFVQNSPAPGKKYLRAALSDGQGNTKQIPIHLLVLNAFKGPKPSDSYEACHNDGDAQNNALSNLRWGTAQDNADDRRNHGTQVRGEEVSLAVLDETQVREIKAAIPNWKKGMGRFFAKKFGVGDSAISAIKNGQTWRHI